MIEELQMDDELQKPGDAGYKSVIEGPRPFSVENLLRNIDPAPDDEADRFVEAIYADRRYAAGNSEPR